MQFSRNIENRLSPVPWYLLRIAHEILKRKPLAYLVIPSRILDIRLHLISGISQVPNSALIGLLISDN